VPRAGASGGINYWIFRGQRDASWERNPTAMRPKCFAVYGIGAKSFLKPKDLQEQLDVEREAVFAFISECLAANLPIPEDTVFRRGCLTGR